MLRTALRLRIARISRRASLRNLVAGGINGRTGWQKPVLRPLFKFLSSLAEEGDGSLEIVMRTALGFRGIRPGIFCYRQDTHPTNVRGP